MSKSVFSETEHYTETAQKIDGEIGVALNTIIRKYAELGYKVREIESIAYGCVQDICCCIRIGQDINRTDARRLAKRDN